MATPKDTLFVRTPHQAQKCFSTLFGKQRHQFVVKFEVNGSQAGADLAMDDLTFVAKMVDRPKINPKTEELHQYNKRRQIYTGIKYEPVRIQMYEDNNGLAQRMWQKYSAYYFGDFDASAKAAYNFDVTQKDFDLGSGFGLVPQHGQGQAGEQHSENSLNAQYYFSAITIYHLYGKKMDTYVLINPRITNFDPDDLDYANSEVSTVSMTILYENLQYKFQTLSSEIDSHAFDKGELFDGGTMSVNGVDSPMPSQNVPDFSQFELRRTNKKPTPPANQVGRLSQQNDYRYNGRASTGSLGMFGNFQFGPNSLANLGQMALSSFPLAAALNMGVLGNPLALNNVSMSGAATASRRGIDGAAYDIAMARASQGSTGFGSIIAEVIAGSMASTAINSDRSIGTPSGIVLSPEGYGVMNTRQSGTAQYGFNPNTAPDGSSWGYTGPGGYQGPYNYYNDGPYVSDRPAGLYGRAGIEPKPLPDYY